MRIEHKFGNLKTAIRELNELGFSANESLISKGLYHVLPIEMRDDYPMMGDGTTPRFVAFLYSTGTLIFVKPYDENPVLMAYQETLEKLTASN
ncbi:MAG: hypothetical protein AABW93_01455 [Nanoarchaeota archaeon]